MRPNVWETNLWTEPGTYWCGHIIMTWVEMNQVAVDWSQSQDFSQTEALTVGCWQRGVCTRLLAAMKCGGFIKPGSKICHKDEVQHIIWTDDFQFLFSSTNLICFFSITTQIKHRCRSFTLHLSNFKALKTQNAFYTFKLAKSCNRKGILSFLIWF